MFGLILAALYVAYNMAANGTTAETAMASTLPFLWWWHIVFVVLLGVIAFIVFLVSLGVMCSKGNGAMGAAGAFLLTPLVIILGAISSALFLGGVYCAELAIPMTETGAAPFSEWNMPLFVVGCVLYGIAVLKQISAKISLNSNSGS